MIQKNRYKKLLEAGGGGPDKLYQQIEKARKALEKAQDAIVTAGDELTQVIVESTAIGGSLQNTIPGEIKQRVADLDQMASVQIEDMLSGQQSSLDSIQEILDNTPFRDLKPKSKSEKRKDISNEPDLSNGPQSQMTETIENLFRKDLSREYRGGVSFEQIKESLTLGNNFDYDEIKGLNIKPQADLIKKDLPRIKEKMRAATRDKMFEESSHLQESGELNFDSLHALGGSDGMPLNFSSLNDPLKVVGI